MLQIVVSLIKNSRAFTIVIFLIIQDTGELGLVIDEYLSTSYVETRQLITTKGNLLFLGFTIFKNLSLATFM